MFSKARWSLPIRLDALLIGAVATVFALNIPSASASKGARVSGTVPKSLAKSNAVVYLESVPGSYTPPAEVAVISQKGLTFVPHLLPVIVGTTVRFPNKDHVRHSVFSPSSARPFNLGIFMPGEKREVTFDKVGVVNVFCNIHPDMSAAVLVLQNPYYAVTDSDGHFSIENVPSGNHTIVLWRERKKPLKRRAVVNGGPLEVDFDAD